MSKSHRLSPASATFRLDWRPSKIIASGLLGLSLLAASGVWLTELAWPAAAAIAILSLGYGIVLAKQWTARPQRRLMFQALDGGLSVDGEPTIAYSIQWRGPCAFVTWRDSRNRIQRLSFWPDTLSATQRRGLRLTAQACSALAEPSRSKSTVAP